MSFHIYYPSGQIWLARRSMLGLPLLTIVSLLMVFKGDLFPRDGILLLKLAWVSNVYFSVWNEVKNEISINPNCSYFGNFPLIIKNKLETGTTWEEMAKFKTDLVWPACLKPWKDILPLVMEGIRSKLLMEQIQREERIYTKGMHFSIYKILTCF